VGATQQFTATVTGAANGAVTWSSTATSTATVSTSGLVTALATGITTIRACAVAEPTKCAQVALQVTAASGPAATTLTSGVPVAGLSGAEDSQRLYRITVPAGVAQLDVQTSGGSGDMDLYVRRGQPPTSSAVDCESEGGANTERCTIATPAAGDWYVLLVGFEAYSGVTLTATASTVTANPLVLSFTQPTMTVSQGGHTTQTVMVQRNGYAGPIALEVVPLVDQNVGVELSTTTLAAGEDDFWMEVSVSPAHAMDAFPIRIRARAAGLPEVEGTVNIQVRTQFAYSGGFTGPAWEMYTISSAGDRCEFDVTVVGTVYVSFDRVDQEGTMTTRVQGTLTSAAKQPSVGNTNCNSGTSSFDVSSDAQSIYPFVGGRVDRQFSSWRVEFYPSAMFGEDGPGFGINGEFAVRISGSSSAGIIGGQPAPLPLLLLPR
jgi:hypothetical protein